MRNLVENDAGDSNHGEKGTGRAQRFHCIRLGPEPEIIAAIAPPELIRRKSDLASATARRVVLLDRSRASDIIIRDRPRSLRRCRLVDLSQCLMARHLR
jgi:hypothetical protein